MFNKLLIKLRLKKTPILDAYMYVRLHRALAATTAMTAIVKDLPDCPNARNIQWLLNRQNTTLIEAVEYYKRATNRNLFRNLNDQT